MALAELSCPSVPKPPERALALPVESRVETLPASRKSTHAYGRAGDLVLLDATGVSLTFARTEDGSGHRPLRGALLDVGLGPEDRSDPLLYWRPGWRDEGGRMHPVIADAVVTTTECAGGATGIRTEGDASGVRLSTVICPEGRGRFRATTRLVGPVSSLPAGAAIADEVHPGTAAVLIDGNGGEWDGERPTRFVAMAEHGVAFLIEAQGATVGRHRPRIAAEIFTSPLFLRYAEVAVRTLDVLAGDSLDALDRAARALGGEPRHLSASFQGQGEATLAIEDAAGKLLATGNLAPSGRDVALPEGFGAAAAVRDDAGVPAARVPLRAQGETMLRAATAPRGTVDFRYANEREEALPVHLVLRGTGGTPDPEPRAPPGSYAGGRSVYLAHGEATLTLAPGSYQVTASHGPLFSLAQERLEIAAGTTTAVHRTLRRVVDAKGWVSADFHLHSAPSPDSPVSLEARVASLLCEGVDFATPTDHNRVSDYTPYIGLFGAEARLGTVPGTEITTAPPPSWGHFNAFPMRLTDQAPEDAAPPYYGIRPVEMLAAARALGARVLQVNHPRMPPSIGYFDLVHLDPRTGRADADFSANFDAVEAFNGIWLETPEKVREGARDLVALARRGLRPTATGNSDSHQLLYEEAGYPRTYVHLGDTPDAPGHDPLIDALLRGETSVSSGPFVELEVDGHRAGSTVRLDGRRSVHAHVRVSAPAWVPVERIEIWRNDEVFQAFSAGPAADGVRFEGEVDVPISDDTVMLAWASAETPLPDVVPYPLARAMGFTGLIYVDADDDGRVTVPPQPDLALPAGGNADAGPSSMK